MLSVLLFVMGVASGIIGVKEIASRYNSHRRDQNQYMDMYSTNQKYDEPSLDYTFSRTCPVTDIAVTNDVKEWSFIYESNLVDKMCVCSTKSGEKLLLSLKMDPYCPGCKNELSCALNNQNFLAKTVGIKCDKCGKEKVEWSVVISIYIANRQGSKIFCIDFEQHQNIGFGANNTLAVRTSVEKIAVALKRALPQKVDPFNNHLLGEYLSKDFKYSNWWNR